MTQESDDFNRADASSLGSAWTDYSTSSKVQVAGNKALGPGAAAAGLAWRTVDNFGDDQFSQAVVGSLAAGGEAAGVSIRTSGVPDTLTLKAYLFKSDGTRSGTDLGKYTSLVSYTSLASWSGTDAVPSNADTIKITASGASPTTVSVYINDVLVKQVTDSETVLQSGGVPGIYLNNATATLDNWTGGDGSGVAAPIAGTLGQFDPCLRIDAWF